MRVGESIRHHIKQFSAKQFGHQSNSRKTLFYIYLETNLQVTVDSSSPAARQVAASIKEKTVLQSCNLHTYSIAVSLKLIPIRTYN